jgi:hypothetical protein
MAISGKHSSRSPPSTFEEWDGGNTSGPLEDVLRRADAELEKSYAESSQVPSGSTSSSRELSSSSEERFVPSGSTEPPPISCTICAEDFGKHISLPAWITPACMHPPSVCSECWMKSIKIDLDSKVLDQIKCPVCDTVLTFDDVKGLADTETFTRQVASI